VTVPEFQARWRWTEGSLAVWDNRSTQHYAVGDYFPQHRQLHRITFTADKAFDLSLTLSGLVEWRKR